MSAYLLKTHEKRDYNDFMLYSELSGCIKCLFKYKTVKCFHSPVPELTLRCALSLQFQVKTVIENDTLETNAMQFILISSGF